MRLSSLLRMPPRPMNAGMPRRRAGFGLLMLVVFMGIIVTILALSMKTIMYAARVQRVSDTWEILESVRLATFQAAPPSGTYPVFRQRIGTNPGRISQLFGPINSGDAANYPDACGGTFNNAQRNNSREWEPFLVRTFDPATGLATPMGVVDDDFIRTSISGVIYLMAVIPQADLMDIDLLDEIFDDNTGAAAGLVRWDTITGTTARLTYMITIDSSC